MKIGEILRLQAQGVRRRAGSKGQRLLEIRAGGWDIQKKDPALFKFLESESL
jgi:hypothetical protein